MPRTIDSRLVNFEEAINASTWVQIDLKALAHNFEQLQKLAAKNMSHAAGVMPVIKADAYGHGMLRVAGCLNGCGCKFFGVSNVSEGAALRAAGFKQYILLFESTLVSDAREIVEYGLTPTVCTMEMAQALDECARQAGIRLPVHVKLDTGMGRLGINEAQALEFIQSLRSQFAHLICEGIYTHFPVADTDREFTLGQMRRFRDIVYGLQNQFITFTYIHAGNSMGLGDYKSDLFNLARPGIMLYGLYPLDDLKTKVHVKPVMSVKTKVIFVQTIAQGRGISYGHTFKASHDMTVAVLPIGYSNGYLRALSNRAFVLVGGVRCPVVGRITMDQTIVDVTALTLSGRTLKAGDEAVIMGVQKGESISADEVAHWAGTINYEILCSLGSRLVHAFQS